jgi:hypothetical protein
MGYMRCRRSQPPAPDAVRGMTRMVRTTQKEAGILIGSLVPGFLQRHLIGVDMNGVVLRSALDHNRPDSTSISHAREHTTSLSQTVQHHPH